PRLMHVSLEPPPNRPVHPCQHVVPVVAVFCAIVHATHKSHFAIHHCDLHMIACKPGVAHSAGLHRRSFLEVSHHIVWWHKTLGIPSWRWLHARHDRAKIIHHHTHPHLLCAFAQMISNAHGKRIVIKNVSANINASLSLS